MNAAALSEKSRKTDIFDARAKAVSALPISNLRGTALASYLVQSVRDLRSYDTNTILSVFIAFTQSFLSILAGPPGTGKTSAAGIFAHALGLTTVHAWLAKSADLANCHAEGFADRYLPVSVERGWASKHDTANSSPLKTVHRRAARSSGSTRPDLKNAAPSTTRRCVHLKKPDIREAAVRAVASACKRSCLPAGDTVHLRHRRRPPTSRRTRICSNPPPPAAFVSDGGLSSREATDAATTPSRKQRTKNALSWAISTFWRSGSVKSGLPPNKSQANEDCPPKRKAMPTQHRSRGSTSKPRAYMRMRFRYLKHEQKRRGRA